MAVIVLAWERGKHSLMLSCATALTFVIPEIGDSLSCRVCYLTVQCGVNLSIPIMLYHRYQEQEAQQCQPEQCQDQSHDHALDQYEDPYLGHYLDQQLDHRLQVREEVHVTQQEEEDQSEEEEPVEDALRPIQHHVQFQPGLQRRYQEVSDEVISVVSVSSFPDALEFIVNAVIDHARGKYTLEFVGNAICKSPSCDPTSNDSCRRCPRSAGRQPARDCFICSFNGKVARCLY